MKVIFIHLTRIGAPLKYHPGLYQDPAGFSREDLLQPYPAISHPYAHSFYPPPGSARAIIGVLNNGAGTDRNLIVTQKNFQDPASRRGSLPQQSVRIEFFRRNTPVQVMHLPGAERYFDHISSISTIAVEPKHRQESVPRSLLTPTKSCIKEGEKMVLP